MVRLARRGPAGAEVPGDGMRVGAPIARPSAVVCIGMNYAAHAAEAGAQPPDVPVMFLKAPNTVVGPYDDAMIPRGSTKTDWEVELAVVIGRRASYLESPAESPEHVAGFATANDLSERSFQLEVSGGQWSKGKVSPGDLILTGTPEGVALSGRFPYLVPGDVVEVEVAGLGRQRQTMIPFAKETP